MAKWQQWQPYKQWSKSGRAEEGSDKSYKVGKGKLDQGWTGCECGGWVWNHRHLPSCQLCGKDLDTWPKLP
eukprot:15084875-Heterocapsa_arctica.AAC.1